MKVLSVDNFAELVNRHGIENYLADLMAALKRDYGRWEDPPYGADCVVPQAGFEATADTVELPLPTSDDEAGIRTAC